MPFAERMVLERPVNQGIRTGIRNGVEPGSFTPFFVV
jgi:hypothetical protein